MNEEFMDQGIECAMDNDGEYPIPTPCPPPGYENAVCPGDDPPPKVSIFTVRVIDNGYDQDYTVSREFESAIRNLLGAMQDAPSIDQVRALIKTRESQRVQSYEDRRRITDLEMEGREEKKEAASTNFTLAQLRWRHRWLQVGYWLTFGTAVATLIAASIR